MTEMHAERKNWRNVRTWRPVNANMSCGLPRACCRSCRPLWSARCLTCGGGGRSCWSPSSSPALPSRWWDSAPGTSSARRLGVVQAHRCLFHCVRVHQKQLHAGCGQHVYGMDNSNGLDLYSTQPLKLNLHWTHCCVTPRSHWWWSCSWALGTSHNLLTFAQVKFERES